MKLRWMMMLAAALATALAALLVRAGHSLRSSGDSTLTPAAQTVPATRLVDLRARYVHDVLPRYVDANVGDTLRVIVPSGEAIDVGVLAVHAESRLKSCPRTRVELDVGGKPVATRCGMRRRNQAGIGPVDVDGIKIAVEVTRLVFADMKGGSSPFNQFQNLRLRGDVRLAIWDTNHGILRGADGEFVVDQPRWTRRSFGNWLQRSSYGIHAAIDIFATEDGKAESVLTPTDGIVYRVYNQDASRDDPERSKAINIYSSATVGKRGERVLFRMQHLSEIFVSSGESVSRGQVIGMTGHTGFRRQIGDHLHFEIRLNPSHFGYEMDGDIFASIPVNPYNFLLEWYGKGQ